LPFQRRIQAAFRITIGGTVGCRSITDSPRSLTVFEAEPQTVEELLQASFDLDPLAFVTPYAFAQLSIIALNVV